jgi:hypothetical protein
MIAGRGCQTQDVKKFLRRMFGNWTSGCECQAQDVRDIGRTENALELDARQWMLSTR